MSNRIAVIIPVLTAKTDIVLTLYSILMQVNLDKIDIVICNASNANYSRQIKKFAKYVSIKEIKLSEKELLKTTVLKNIRNRYITFITPNEIFASPTALQLLTKTIQDSRNKMLVYGNVLRPTKKHYVKENPFNTLSGKIYKRSWLRTKNWDIDAIYGAKKSDLVQYFNKNPKKIYVKETLVYTLPAVNNKNTLPFKSNLIDVIIPTYKAHKTILRTLASIAIQTVVDEINVTLVNDCCPEGNYQEFIDLFSENLTISEIVTQQNSGAGIAKQVGIENTGNKFITFIDPDDAFSSPISLQILLTAVKHPDGTIDDTIKSVMSNYIVFDKGYRRVKFESCNIAGKLYRRDFILKYSINHGKYRVCEDRFFNTTFRLLCDNANEQIKKVKHTTYLYIVHNNSITMQNKKQFFDDTNVICSIDGTIECIEKAIQIKGFTANIGKFICWFLLQCYLMYLSAITRKSIFLGQCVEYSKKFYHLMYIPWESKIAKYFKFEIELIDETSSISDKASFSEFIDLLKNEPYHPNNIYNIWKKIPKKMKMNNVQSKILPANFYKNGAY